MVKWLNLRILFNDNQTNSQNVASAAAIKTFA